MGVAVISAKETRPPPALPIPGTKFSVPLPFLPSDPEPVYVPLRDHVDPQIFTPAAVNLFALGVFLLALTTLMSAWDQYRWRTIGIIVSVCIAMTLLKVFGMAAPALEWMQSLSFFTPYSPEWSVYVNARAPDQLWNWRVEIPADERSGLSPLSNNVILLSLAALCYAVAGVIFFRRDLPAPL
jgi:ABC-2 type transport system permease protein